MASSSQPPTSTSNTMLHMTPKSVLEQSILEKVEHYLRRQYAIVGERIFVSLSVAQDERQNNEHQKYECQKYERQEHPVITHNNSTTTDDTTKTNATNPTTETQLLAPLAAEAAQQQHRPELSMMNPSGIAGSQVQSSLFEGLETNNAKSSLPDTPTHSRQESSAFSLQKRPSTVPDSWREAPSLDILRQTICGCLNCKLGPTRTNFVFGVGNPNADIMVIGEAPGADEDAQGEPFVGRGGQLLTKILEAIHLQREEVYIANIIKCRPPNNRRPEADEVEQCEPYLLKQIELVQPKFILALGLTAVNTLFKATYKMGDIRGKQLSFRGIPLIATYHPAALLRNPEWKKATWEDVKLLRRLYDETRQG